VIIFIEAPMVVLLEDKNHIPLSWKDENPRCSDGGFFRMDLKLSQNRTIFPPGSWIESEVIAFDFGFEV